MVNNDSNNTSTNMKINHIKNNSENIEQDRDMTWIKEDWREYGEGKRESSSDIASYFFRPSKVWSMLHHGSVGASSEKIKEI